MKNLTIRGYLPAAVYLCALFILHPSANAGLSFNTVINVPPTPAPESIGSDTQLNLFDGGSLPSGFDAGVLVGPSSDIEVNIHGGTVGDGFRAGSFSGASTNITVNISGGAVGSGFQAGSTIGANTNVTVNITGGTVGSSFEAQSGSVVNVSGGSLGAYAKASNGSAFNISGGFIGDDFQAQNNTVVNISGGAIGENFTAGYDTNIAISGGLVPGLNFFGDGGQFHVSGGNLGPVFGNQTDMTITGSEFRFNGVPVAGLNVPGDSVSFPTNTGGYLTSTFSDGAVFVHNPNYLNGTLTLTLADTPAKPPVINSPSDPAPLGLRAGQTLYLNAGANLVDNFTALDATLNITGGDVGDRLTVIGTTVNMSAGSIGSSFSAQSGSVLNISGGSIAGYSNVHKSELNISGGELSRTVYLHDTIASITGGVMDSIRAGTGSTLNVRDGAITRFISIAENSTVNISGGARGLYCYVHVESGSTVNLVGTSFILDGVDLTAGLTPGESITIDDRDVCLVGVLADGAPFDFDLNSQYAIHDDWFDPGATLRVTLVPEPHTFLLFIASGLAMMRTMRHSY